MKLPKGKTEFKEITDIEIEGIDPSDHPKYCDAFIASAVWAKSGNALTDDELDELNEDSDLVYQAVQDYLY